jgi:hypothetical protein
LTVHARKGITHTFNTADNLFRTQVPWGRLCQVMGEPNFWNGTRSKKTTFRNKDELLAYCMDDVSVLRQACCAFPNVFLKLFKIGSFCQATTISICNKKFRTMFLKSDTVCIIPRGGYQMGDRQSVEALQWLAYIVRMWKCYSCR